MLSEPFLPTPVVTNFLERMRYSRETGRLNIRLKRYVWASDALQEMKRLDVQTCSVQAELGNGR